MRGIKKILFVLPVVSALSLSCCGHHASAPGRVVLQSICAGWEFARADSLCWMPARVPGTVHTDLFAAGVIPDPFWRDNEHRQQWIDKADWIYRTSFEAGDAITAKSNIEIVFEGLDTYAEVTLNGHRVLSADNMFRTWEADVKPYLKQGRNDLEVCFRSPVGVSLAKYDANPYKLFGLPGNDQARLGGLGDKLVSMWNRKTPSHFGWDWGPRFVTSGIWRPVHIRAWEGARIKDVHYIRHDISGKSARLTARLKIESDMAGRAEVELKVNGKRVASARIQLDRGLSTVDIPLEIGNPQLWWPSGMGRQNLYRMDASLADNDGNVLDMQSLNIGLRTVRVVQKPDRWGTSFYFEVNGIPMFAKGANMIPTDNFLPRTTGEDYRRLVQSAVDANMNLLRVWGGGSYEDDRFYDACDSLGLLVWQDFMFACSMYPTDSGFLKSVEAEAIDNVRRLRNHASLAIWCGNNEMTQAWYNWGWKDRQDVPQHYRNDMWEGYKRIFFETLPRVVSENDPGRFYWPSSPGSSFCEPQNYASGDVHYWKYRGKRLPLEVFRTEIGRFMSEYGFQSTPTMSVIERYTLPEDRDFDSGVFRAHVKAEFEPDLALHYIATYYDGKDDFASRVFMSQIYQAEAMKYAIEHHRMRMPFCMGSLYWQLNDCWPGSSWSSLDYHGNWKASHYAARRAFAPVLAAADIWDDSVRVYGVTDLPQQQTLHLSARLMSFRGELLSDFSRNVVLGANTSTMLFESTATGALGPHDKKDAFLHLALTDSKGRVLSSGNVFFTEVKNLDLPAAEIRTELKPIDGGVELTLTSPVYAKYVEVSVPGAEPFVSDNYFDLLPGQPVTVVVKGSFDASAIRVRNYLYHKR
ncbi:beta-mannosidase [Bacteroidia bacterium]|nr:beta-mannosidase [Bacteroidia bacterium]